jgi:hypothetical protein
MLRCFFLALLGAAIAAGSAAHAACLPTLGTDDCLHWSDRQIQLLEHHYLDAPLRREPGTQHSRESRKKPTAGAK